MDIPAERYTNRVCFTCAKSTNLEKTALKMTFHAIKQAERNITEIILNVTTDFQVYNFYC